MDKQQVLELAEEAGIRWATYDKHLLAFAELVAKAERERIATMLESQKYMTLEPLRMHTGDEVWQTVRGSVQGLAAQIRRA